MRFAKDVPISYLLFVDDSFIFMQASMSKCKHLKEIFYCYTQASCHFFNLEKSCMFFSGEISSAEITAIRGIFNLKVVSKYEKYLGLSLMIGRKKTSYFFNDVNLKVLNKISNWQHKIFSSGGREVLSKAVAQTIPAYTMSVLKLSRGLCDDIQRAVVKFWWGGG